MKKHFLFYLSVCLYCSAAHAQSTPSVNSSYTVQNSPIVVYPVNSATGHADKYIHFMLNATTKFYISQVLDSGYVIRVWYFNDRYRYKIASGARKGQPVDSVKQVFYDTMISRSRKIIAAQRTLDSATQVLATTQKKISGTQVAINKSKDTISNAAKALKANATPPAVPAAAKPKKGKSAKSTTQQTTDLQSSVQQFTAITDQLAAKAKASIAGGKPDSNAIKQTTRQLQTLGSQITTKVKALQPANTAWDSYLNRTNQLVAEFSRSTDSIAKKSDELDKAKLDLVSANAAVTKATQDLRTLRKPTGEKPPQGKSPKNEAAYLILKPDLNMPIDDLTKDTLSLPAMDYEALGFVDSWGNYMEFFMPTKSLSDCLGIYEQSDHFTWGFLSVPIKIRVAPFNFEQNINFGFTFGWKWQPVSTTNISHNLLGGVAVGSVNVTSTNSSSSASATGGSNPTTAPAVSFSAGYMFQYDKFQAGMFVGWDIASPPANYKFVNSGTPWIGIAIGVSLFGENKTSASNQTQ